MLLLRRRRRRKVFVVRIGVSWSIKVQAMRSVAGVSVGSVEHGVRQRRKDVVLAKFEWF
jgi:hypothetical protein